ncbi:AraC family transcriptional regulator [Dyadobacter sp. 676]|uniref:AraC family transcriptional regulator n=1 Tax=Dyadobacter sp. 676 TaxID=3088362 RepID=A0AAU8FQW6_9BACT
MNSGYQEFRPSPELQQYVECYWLHRFETKGDQESPVQRCMPFGTLELILHLDDNRCRALFEESWQLLPPAFFVGLFRDVVHWKTVGSCRKFGIRLRPESALELFAVPIAPLFNQFTDLESCFGKEINRLVENVYGLQDTNEVVRITEAFLLGLLKNMRSARHPVSQATRLIRQSKGRLSIDALSENLYISKRQLERVFKDHYGTTPKMYQRIIRFRNAYESFCSAPSTPNWAEISYNSGYADQAHFIRDFKEFTREVPTHVFQDRYQYFRLPDKQVMFA